MKIKELEYLPADAVYWEDPVDGPCNLRRIEVSLFGHWTHIRNGDIHHSVPSNRVTWIVWA
jgi:hypothetical protein